MNSQLSERIRLHSANFSKGQRMIARYIEEHSEQVAFMTASRLGQTVGVSESTVVRFATEIGYSGYPALQQAMQEMIRSKMTSVQRLERTSTTIPMDRLLDEVLDQDIDILKRTKENVDREAFYRAADALVNAKKVYVLGAGSSLALATFMAHYLRLVFETVHLVEATSEATILQQMVHVGEGDAVIAISFPRYSKKAVKTMKYASSQKATTVAITDSPLSPPGPVRLPRAAGPQRHGVLCGLSGGALEHPQRLDCHRGHQKEKRGGGYPAEDRGNLG